MSKKYELTPVFDGAKDLPVRRGWYPSLTKHEPIPLSQWPRRYWDGNRFSILVFVGESDAEAARCKAAESIFENHELMWCGLTSPYRK